MEVIMKTKSGSVDAKAIYNEETKETIVCKGSLVSSDVAHSEKFHSALSIERLRAQYVSDRIVMDDVAFKSPSMASNFVTGRSTNGYATWKVSSKKTLKQYLDEAK